MKNCIFYVFAGLFFTSCASYHFNYFPVPSTNMGYANRGEVHASGLLGTSGAFAQTGYAITNNISIDGQYGSQGIGRYHANEGDVTLGFNSTNTGNHSFLVRGGYGLGSTYNQDSGRVCRNFNGTFNKPFLELGLSSVRTGDAGVHADNAFSVRINYMTYNGYTTKGNTTQYPFAANTFFYEPCFNSTIGGKYVRIIAGTGFAFKNINDIGVGVKVFPWHFNFGIFLLFGRKYSG